MCGFAKLLLATATISMLMSDGPRATEQSKRTASNFNAAQELLAAAFPETTAPHYKGQISASGDLNADWTDWVLIGVGVYVHDPQSSTHSRRVLGGRLHISEGKVGEAYFEGEFVRSAAVTNVARAVTLKESWTADDMKLALAAAGAKFTSQNGEEFLDAAKLERLAPMFGTIKKSTARFVATPPMKDNEMNARFEPMARETGSQRRRPADLLRPHFRALQRSTYEPREAIDMPVKLESSAYPQTRHGLVGPGVAHRTTRP